MNIKGILLIFVLLLFIGCGNKLHQRDDVAKVDKKPNIIIVLADDLGYNDVGFNGSTDIKTPNIDKIANNGVVFTNGYVSYAVCGPSRAGLMTGRCQDRFGFSRNPLFAPKDSTQGLPLSEETLATVLKRGGYRTMAIGKWHLGAHPSQRPLNRGFDEFFGFLSGGHHYFPEKWDLNDISEVKSQYDPYRTKLLKNNDRIEETEYLTDALSREAVSFIESNKEQPFFLYLAYNAPHTPLQATQKYLDRYENIEDTKRRTYAAMVSAMDDGVGRVLNTLEKLNLDRNTIVFFLSDNGGPEPHNASDNGLLREGKGTLYDGGIRVPFAVQWPTVIPKGEKYDRPIISLDIFATAIHYAGVNPKKTLDGINIIPYISSNNEGIPHEFLFWRMFDKKAFAVRNGNMKVTKWDIKSELFNITNDIGEENSLEDAFTLQQLESSYYNWNTKNSNPVFLGLSQNDEYNKAHSNRFAEVEKY
ncbi:MAG: sulfatase-like hydrolase/transferase [Flavobacteriaceae bacterium]|nr:sulfatase-like hydrolase/transferase [Flavobacteriaceae bacterium]